MKKNKLKESFFEELRKVPIVQVAAEKSGLSRQSIYRWRKEDQSFADTMDEAISEGETLVNDMSEAQLLNLIKDKNFQALRFWLSHRNPKFKQRIEIDSTVKTIQELSPEQKEQIRVSLELANINLNNNYHEYKQQ